MVKDRCVIGITSEEKQIAHLALFDECQLCNLRFPTGNTTHNCHCMATAKYGIFTQDTRHG